MKKFIKIGVLIIIVGILAVAANVIYLYKLTPKEHYPEDTYLISEEKKSALIIVAHDDDATLFSGTTSLLAADGWDISFMCFYTNLYKPEVIPLRKLEMQKVKEIEGFENIELIDFTVRRSLDTVEKPWLPIPYEDFKVHFKVDSLRRIVLQAIEKYNPTVIFTLDNVIGFYGHPEHVLVGQIVEEICGEYKEKSIIGSCISA